MSVNVPFIGRLGQAYAKIEATYGAAVTLVATDAFRHLDLGLVYSPRNRSNAPDRLLTPDLRRRITNRATASFDLRQALMWPSGTIKTAPELSVFFEHGFGAKKVGALTTTVSAAPAPTTTGCTLASAAGLAVGDAILIAVTTAPSPGKYVRFIATIATNAVTWTVALPVAPTAADAVKDGVTYKPATDPASSLTIAHYLATSAGGAQQIFTRELKGCVVDKITMDFDANSEPMMSLSGPARSQTRPAQAQPAAFTTIGTAIPSGISGELRVGAVAYPFLKAQIGLANEMTLRNAEYGTAQATGFYRRGRRGVDVSIDAYVEDPTPLYVPGEATTTVPILLQTGDTEGQIWAVYCPLVEFELPATPDNPEELQWSFKGVALGNTGNDEVYLAQL